MLHMNAKVNINYKKRRVFISGCAVLYIKTQTHAGFCRYVSVDSL